MGEGSKKMIQFETDQNNLINLISRLNTELDIGLLNHGQNNCSVVWSVGNCLIVARMVDINLSELELIRFRKDSIDQTANDAWNYLMDRLKRSGIRWKRVADLERVARKTLKDLNHPTYRASFENEELYEEAMRSFNAERVRLNNITAREAANEYLGKGEKSIIVNQNTVMTGENQGRYRLTKDEIDNRRKIRKKAEKIKRKNPEKYWKEIANELEIPERTLRDWRHNPIYD
jgi:hypothetical protein